MGHNRKNWINGNFESTWIKKINLVISANSSENSKRLRRFKTAWEIPHTFDCMRTVIVAGKSNRSRTSSGCLKSFHIHNASETKVTCYIAENAECFQSLIEKTLVE